jgi:hypothetical protein
MSERRTSGKIIFHSHFLHDFLHCHIYKYEHINSVSPMICRYKVSNTHAKVNYLLLSNQPLNNIEFKQKAYCSIILQKHNCDNNLLLYKTLGQHK